MPSNTVENKTHNSCEYSGNQTYSVNKSTSAIGINISAGIHIPTTLGSKNIDLVIFLVHNLKKFELEWQEWL